MPKRPAPRKAAPKSPPKLTVVPKQLPEINELGPKGPPANDPSPVGQQQLLEFLGEEKKESVIIEPDNTRRVTVMKDHTVKYPELYLEVFLAADQWETPMFIEMFARAECRKARSLETADLVVFGGGSDVHPELYGETAMHSTVMPSIQRDLADIELYAECLSQGKPMVGVCRGAQFLAAMQGAGMYQDVNNHMGAHPIYDVRENKPVPNASSSHHQMVMNHESGGMQILATATRADKKWTSATSFITGQSPDVEAFFYRNPCILGVQGHPEYREYAYYSRWFLGLVHEFMNENPDLKYDKGALRIKEELLAQRMNGLTDRTKAFVAKYKKEKN